MTDDEAAREARSLLGGDAVAVDRATLFPTAGARALTEARYVVGPPTWELHAGGTEVPVGFGPTWKDALVALRLRKVVALLARYRFVAHDEHALYVGLEEALTKGGVAYEREKPLTTKGRITSRLDFYLPEDRTAIEVKVQGSPGDILRQLERYQRDEAVDGLLLVTTVSRFTLIPDMIEGKRAMAYRIHGGFY